VAGEDLLDLNGGDVLTAGDDVLLAVAQLDRAVPMHHGEIAGVEPAPLGVGTEKRDAVAPAQAGSAKGGGEAFNPLRELPIAVGRARLT
jgi:hypothetical protein